MNPLRSFILCLVFAAGLTFPGRAAKAAHQGPTRDKFREANQAYAERNYEKARELYRQLLEGRVADAVLFAKLGNTYVKLGQPGPAVLMYERALRLEPRSTEARDNLRQIEPPDNRRRPFILLVPILGLRDYLSLDEWAWLMAGFWLLLSLLIAGACLLKPPVARRLCLRLTWVAALMLVLSSSLLGARCWSDEYARQGIVLESLVSRFGPGAQYKAHLELPAGRRVRVISVDEEWAEIAVPGASQVTYIEASHLEEI